MEELQALLRQAQDGDVDAYGQLVRRFQDMAVGYAYTVLGDFHLALNSPCKCKAVSRFANPRMWVGSKPVRTEPRTVVLDEVGSTVQTHRRG